MTPHEILRKLILSGHEAYYVGGYVRDTLLGRKSDDVDLVTSARPKHIIDIFKKQDVKLVGESFGVVIVDNTEVATFRLDRYGGLSDKNVEIKYADTLQEDLARRDFTINSLAMNEYGKIIDLYNSEHDLRLEIIKFVGDPVERINEDPNRIIRAIRFATTLGFVINDDSFMAIKNNSELVKYVAKERIRKEVMKTICSTRKASRFFLLASSLDVLEYIFPSLLEGVGVKQNRYHGANETIFYHNLKVGDAISQKYPLVKLAGYLHDVGKVYTKAWNPKTCDWTFYKHDMVGSAVVRQELRDLRFSKEEIEKVGVLIDSHMMSLPTTKRSHRRRLHQLSDRGVHYKEFLRLRLADRLGNLMTETTKLSVYKNVLRTFKEIIEQKEPFGLRDLAIDGNDVMQILHIGPSKEVGVALKNLLDRVMGDPTLNTKETLIEILTKEK